MSILHGLPECLPLRSGGVTLHARRLGRGPRLALLHGGPGLDHHILLPLAVPLAERFEVLLPDLPGHGRSHAAGAGLPDLDAVRERTGRWLARLEPAVSVVIGHSLGAWLLREMLHRCALRPLAAVLLSSPVPRLHGGGGRAVRPWAGKDRPGRRGREASLAREFLEACAEEVDGSLSPGFVEALGRSRLRPPGDYRALLGQLRRALDLPLGEVDPGCPVLVLTGETDSTCTPDEARRLTEATRGARLEVLGGAGHVPFSTDVESVLGELHRFLDALI
jgi:magnesium chelatase accessory protein